MHNKCISHLKWFTAKYLQTNKVDGLFMIPFGPLIPKTVSPLDTRSLIARRNPGF